MAVETNPQEIAEIRREMARIRHEIHADVNVAAMELSRATDWRHYIHEYPWAAAGAAVVTGYVLGYLFIPGRRRKYVVEVDADSSDEREESLPRHSKRQDKAKKSSLFGMLMGFAAPIAMRAAQSYALNFLEAQLAPEPGGRFGVEGGPSNDPTHPRPPTRS